MARGLTKEQETAIRQAVALEELTELGARIALVEPGCVVAVLHSTEGKRRQFSSVSAVGVLTDVQSFLAYQDRLKPDAPSRFVVSMEPTPEVEVVAHDVGSENEHKRVRRELRFDIHGRVVGHVDAN